MMLILISGLPGSGKTTLARAFSAQYGALHLNSDILRREMALMGNYTDEDKARVYTSLQARAQEALAEGQNVVVDSTFYKESIRQPFRELAATARAPVFWVEVRAQEQTIHERLKSPRPDSEADFAVYEKIRDAAESFTEPHLVLWSDTMPLEKMVADLAQYTHL